MKRFLTAMLLALAPCACGDSAETNSLPPSKCEEGQVELVDGGCSDEIPESATVINANEVGGDFDGAADAPPGGGGQATACCVPGQDYYGNLYIAGACWLPSPSEPGIPSCTCTGPYTYFDYNYNTWVTVPWQYNGFTCVVE
jgi:hypothetical protein